MLKGKYNEFSQRKNKHLLEIFATLCSRHTNFVKPKNFADHNVTYAINVGGGDGDNDK